MSPTDITIKKLEKSNWEQVREIYIEGLATRNATFQTEAPCWDIWDETHHHVGRLVAVVDGKVVGWCALTPISSRPVYRGVAEVSIYISKKYTNKGIGSQLMNSLIKGSEAQGVWTLQASIFPENETSILLHKKFGFRIVGRREKIAQLDGIWRDTILVERRKRINY
ncbi:N-acetyltransferase family protein [Alkalihalobacillus sp. 1P02AB]|uniref:GNAT family N-acetyltransferase n=1 Tax=Alkalihalobacillus sp. 1P02AB TaxID=3132260 RepID=UPI0039A417B9